MGVCCGNTKPNEIRSLQHLNVERCIEYRSNNGQKIIIDKEEYLLGEYF